MTFPSLAACYLAILLAAIVLSVVAIVFIQALA